MARVVPVNRIRLPALVLSQAPVPDFTPGVWTNITPPVDDIEETFGASTIIFDPSNRNVLYAAMDQRGLFKSTDFGGAWAELGSGSASSGSSTTRLDSPVNVAVDPTDPTHLVATQGIRGTSQGFWVSTDGGANWTKPSGFSSVSPTMDVTTLAIDPTDWEHMLIGTHTGAATILETSDAGSTWTEHEGDESWPAGTSMGISILHHPTLDQGDSSTWLIQTDGEGIWRTTNSAGSWTQVSTTDIPHGMVHSVTYMADGTIYSGGFPAPVKSTNNGASFTELSALASNYFLFVGSDGTNLYTRVSYPLIEGYGDNAVMSRSTNAGVSWSAMGSPGNQTFTNGPLHMSFDEVNGVLYTANWNAGIWAYKVPE